MTTTAERPRTNTRTDSDNAQRLVVLHRDRIRYVPKFDAWLVWDEQVWKTDESGILLQELAKEVGHAIRRDANAAYDRRDEEAGGTLFGWSRTSLSAPRIRAMIELARGIEGVPVEHELLDANPWLLGVENGVIDLRTGTLRPGTPSDLMTMQAPVQWDADARASRWERAMEEWFPDPTVRAYVQRLAGAALVGSAHEHVFIIHYGGGRNGKGTFVRALQRVLGPYTTVIHLSLLVEQRHGQHDTVKASLFRKRLAVASETERRVKLNESSVKNLTGGDRITARRLYQDLWEFDPTHSLWLQTNHLPEISGRDRGIWSRIRVVKWEGTFEGEKQNTNLDQVLAGEAPGILRWLVQGCLEWQAQGLAEPEAVLELTRQYRSAEDAFVRFASDEGLIFGADLSIRADTLHGKLSEWERSSGVTVSPKDLSDWLQENGAVQRRERLKDGSRPRVWYGVGVES